jgi:DNA-directed RNA polymerase
MTDFDRSLNRLLDSEAHRAGASGWGATKQGQAVVRQYRDQLAQRIGAERALGRRRYKDVWKALRGLDDETLALRLLIAGINVAGADDLGTDRDGEKNLRDMARWVGRNLGQQRELGLRVGAWGIDTLTALPIFALDGDILKLTASADAIMDEALARDVKNNALLSPLTAPPPDWTQISKGGLPADHWAKVSLVREHHPSIHNAVHYAIGKRQMDRVLEAINALQRAPFTINVPVLDFISRQRAAPEQRSIFHTDMTTAEAMACAPCFWVPLNIDFRGRLYGVPHFNFAREDRIRALFLFANGERIGEEGLKWLKAHVAGTAGDNAWSSVKKPGKFGFDERIAWTDKNIDTLRTVGEAVLRGDDPKTIEWALPKDRYQFIAACVELVQALDVGPDFITRLPLTFDGSCSGLQHLCAMTRAEEGRFVNLVEAEEPDDFYSHVAFRAWNRVHNLLPDLMSDPLDRDIVKQPAMSHFYGSRPGGFSKSKGGRWRPYGMTKQIIGVLEKRREQRRERGEDAPPIDKKGAKQLAHAIYGVIGDMVPRARAVFDFLRKLARLCAKEGKSLRWTTPLGLPVINCYYEADKKRIPIWLNGRRSKLNFIVGDKEDIDEDKAADAVTANFVHSLDAAHLQLIALAAAKEGIELVTVHDSFGCIAPRAARLKEIIYEEFERLHMRHSPLAGVWVWARANLPKDAKLPTLPGAGNLKLEGVRNYHAFS